MSPLLTSREVAEILGKSEKWVNAAARDRIIPARKVGHTWRFTEADVQAYVDGAVVTALPAASSAPRRSRKRIEGARTEGLERRTA